MLESVKHYLWHGNVARARDRIEDIHCFLDNEEVTGENSRKLRKALGEFDTYVVVNEALIPNYGERWRNEESIATGFVESAVNQIVSKRFSKKQQMQWTKKSAHLVLQMRTQVLDERLEDTFRDCRPSLQCTFGRRLGLATFSCCPGSSFFHFSTKSSFPFAFGEWYGLWKGLQ